MSILHQEFCPKAKAYACICGVEDVVFCGMPPSHWKHEKCKPPEKPSEIEELRYFDECGSPMRDVQNKINELVRAVNKLSQ